MRSAKLQQCIDKMPKGPIKSIDGKISLVKRGPKQFQKY